jgi:hypothetical protein
VLHFVIAFVAAGVYYAASRKLDFMTRTIIIDDDDFDDR